MRKCFLLITIMGLLVACAPSNLVEKTPTPESIKTTTILTLPTPVMPSIFPAGSVDLEISLPLGKGTISDLAWSPDGTMIAVGGSAGIRLYKADTLEEIRFIPTPYLITSLDFSPDGLMIVSGSSDLPFSSRENWRRSSPFVSNNNFVQLWDVETGNQLASLEAGFSYVTSVAFSPDGTLIASGSMYPDDSGVRIWKTDTVLNGEYEPWQLHKEHTRGIFGIDFSPDGSLLLTGAGDNSARLWDVYGENMQSILMYRPESKVKVFALDYSPNGGLVALAGADFLHNTPTALLELWNPQSGELVFELDGHESSLDSVAFSPDGRLLASGGSYPDNKTHIWDVSSGEKIFTLQGHASGVRNVDFSPDGKILASSGWDGVINLWDVNSWELIDSNEEHTSVIYSAAFSPDEQILATGGDEGFIRLWNVETGQKIKMLDSQSSRVTSLVFSPDSTTLIAGTDETSYSLQVWGVISGERFDIFFGHQNFIQALVVSPDGTMLASGGALGDNSVRIWNLISETPTVQILEGHTRSVKSLAFSMDGKTLATGDGKGIIRVVDVESAAVLVTIEAHDCAVSALYFDIYGNLVSGGCKGSIRFWDLSNGTLLRELEGVEETVSRLEGGFEAGDLFVGFANGDIWILHPEESVSSIQIVGGGGAIKAVLPQPDGIRVLMDVGDGMPRVWKLFR